MGARCSGLPRTVHLVVMALEWFRNRKHAWNTWVDCCEAFRERFGTPRWEKKIEDQARTRTQGPDESVADYITGLQTIFRHFRIQWSVQDQIDLAYDNLKPEIRIMLRRSDVWDFTSLERLAREKEVILLESGHFRLPPAKDGCPIPEAGYQPKKVKERRQPQACAVDTQAGSAWEEKLAAMINKTLEEKLKELKPELKPDRDTRGPVNTQVRLPVRRVDDPDRRMDRSVKCWNCDKSGHLWGNCRAPRKIFCYKCGQKEVIKRNCPRCSENESRKTQ